MNGKTVDETIIVDAGLPKRWRCPHCGKTHKMDPYAEEVFMEYFTVLRCCGKCGHVHCWKLKLTDDFKKKVVNMLVGEREADHANGS